VVSQKKGEGLWITNFTMMRTSDPINVFDYFRGVTETREGRLKMALTLQE
jgi:hypothetical protein